MNAMIGRLTSLSKKYKSKFPEDNVSSLGGKYFKKLKSNQISSYGNLSQAVMRPDLISDHHLGDADFKSKIIGNVDGYIDVVKGLMSEYYTVYDKKKKTFDFPNKLLKTINTSKSAFNPEKLMDNTVSYITRKDKRKLGVKEHPRVRKLVFKYWTSIWENIQAIKEESSDVQQELILTGLAPNTNSGYPFWTRQTKKNFPKMFGSFLEQFFPTIYSKYKELIKSDISLTADIILDTVKQATIVGYHPPFTLFYRTQGGENFETKHRSVFGGDILQKAVGSLWATAKHMTKELVYDGPLPWIAWQEWTGMFETICNNLPLLNEDEEFDYISSDTLNKVWTGITVPDGMHKVEVYGEDFSGYDQTIIREDLEWITRHKQVGWIMKWVLDIMEHSEVWSLGMRINDIFFKSGQPFTSEFGSIIHRCFMEHASDHMGGICLGGTVLSDDNLGWYVGFDEKKYLEYADIVGLEIDPDRSSLYSRDKIVSFLKVLCGYTTKSTKITYIGDPQSRYYGFAHSEREMIGQYSDKELKVNLQDLYQVTGDIEVDALLAKLGSFARSGTPLADFVLRVVKDTVLGIKAIQAIVEMPVDEEFSPYRIDMFIGFSPIVLKSLNVQHYLSEPILS